MQNFDACCVCKHRAFVRSPDSCLHACIHPCICRCRPPTTTVRFTRPMFERAHSQPQATPPTMCATSTCPPLCHRTCGFAEAPPSSPCSTSESMRRGLGKDDWYFLRRRPEFHATHSDFNHQFHFVKIVPINCLTRSASAMTQSACTAHESDKWVKTGLMKCHSVCRLIVISWGPCRGCVTGSVWTPLGHYSRVAGT